MAKIQLADDGTLDTVLACECGREFRYNFDGGDDGQTYDEFVEWAIADASDGHDCADAAASEEGSDHGLQ
jgi:hypothetical protein